MEAMLRFVPELGHKCGVIAVLGVHIYLCKKRYRLMNINMAKKSVIAALVVAGMSLSVFAQAKNPQAFYCKYCGQKASSIAALTAAACIRHPNGPHKGKHEPAL